MQSLLRGPIELQMSRAFSFFGRYGYVKRKGTRTARKLPDDFEMVKAAFLGRVADIVKTHKISPSMIVNFDQTGAKIIPVDEWPLEIKWSKQVDIVTLDDKRELTVLLAGVGYIHVRADEVAYNLESEAPVLCIFDVFAAHRCKSFLEACSIKHAFVPAGCTGQLQELFSSWYASSCGFLCMLFKH